MTVPDGCAGGEELAIDFGGQTFFVAVPAGLTAGEVFAVSLPAASPAESSAVEVIVPEGIEAGMPFAVTFGTEVFEVTCPDGCGGGSIILVDVPPEQPPPTQPSSSRRPDRPPPEEAPEQQSPMQPKRPA